VTDRTDGMIVKTADVTRVYHVGQQEVHALRGVNFWVKQGEYLGVMGRSGSGKTTLLNIIGGLDRPTEGEVHVFGENIRDLSDRRLTEFRRHKIGFVFQSFALMPTMSAFENVELPLRMIGVRRRERRQRVMECLELVGLTKWAKHRPQEMSGGQQQRVAIARSLVNRPGLILADEPTGELDTEEEGVSIVMSSHDPAMLEYLDFCYNLADGRVLNERD